MRILTLLLCLILTGTAHAKLLYVDVNDGSCSDTTISYATNDEDNPWCQLLRATHGRTDLDRTAAANTSEAAQAGDTVYVAAGTYQATAYNQGGFGESGLYEPANAGSSGNWITFEAVGTVNLTTTSPGVGSGASVIGSTKEYIKWVGFTIDQANVLFAQGNGLCQIRANNVEFHNITLIGAYTDYGFNDNHTGIMIHGDRSGGGATCVSGLTGIVIKNSSISGFTGESSDNDTGITMYCLDTFTIEQNEIYSNHNGISGKSSYTGAVGQSYIRKNLIRNNSSNGVYLQEWKNVDITQNVIRDNAGYAAVAFHCNGEGTPNDGPDDINVVNNTFDGNVAGIYPRNTCAHLNGNSFKNNISTNNTYGMLTSDASCESTDNMGADDIAFDYNVHEHSGSFWVNDAFSTVSAALSNFQSTYSQGANSVDDVDCLYADESGNDFRLCTASGVPEAGCSGASPCIEGGANEGVDVLDLDSDTSTVDAITIGAYITGSETIGPESADAATVTRNSAGTASTHNASGTAVVFQP